MYPAYRHADSYPYYANPMHYTPNDNPRAKKTDPRTPNSPLQAWPYGGHCYPAPPEFHPYCNHHYFGGPYTFRPPYPHYLPPPPPCYAAYPPFPGAHAVPPPHYSIDQPRYDYDKTTIIPHHCFGCTHREDEKKPRIEQVEPEINKSMIESMLPKDYPYPIMWIPPSYMKNTEQEEMGREKHLRHDPISPKPLEKQDKNGEAAQDLRLPFPIVWLPSKAGNDTKENDLDRVTHDGLPLFAKDDKNGNEFKPEMIKKPNVQKVIPVKQLETEEEKKKKNPKGEEPKLEKTDDRVEGKPSSKTSKLPPVCLRIDPLPRKKNGSRSPSPPAHRENRELKDLKKTSEIEANKDDSCGKLEREIEADKVEKKKLSEHEAALIIQSVYRGFEVRKSQPLMKLRQITDVRKQAVELRNRIQDLESHKQKLIIGETIMNLLLKLDTIQGLHPMVRDVRKSVAKELVNLHEKLDSIMFVKPETSSENITCITTPNAIREVESTGLNNDQLQMTVEPERCVEAPTAASVVAEQDPNTKELVEPKVELPMKDAISEREQMSIEADRCVEAPPAASVVVEHDLNTKEAMDLAEPKVELPTPAALMVVEHDYNTTKEVVEPKVELPTPAPLMVVEQDYNTKEAELPMEYEDPQKVDGDENGTEASVAASGGDRKVVEENERLRTVVEELMKAGNEQLGVITELTGRVKDLERKLSKSKKKKKTRKGWGRGGVVEDEFKGCVV